MARKPKTLRAVVTDWVTIMADLYRSISEPQPVTGDAYITWDHDGLNVDSFMLEVDDTEYDLGVPANSYVSGTTYHTLWPEAVSSGSHNVAVYAVNEDGRTTSAIATLEKPA